MKKRDKYLGLLETRKATAFFAIISLFGGFLFLNHSITGSVISNNNSSFNTISIIALMLILCSIILGAYSVKNK